MVPTLLSGVGFPANSLETCSLNKESHFSCVKPLRFGDYLLPRLPDYHNEKNPIPIKVLLKSRELITQFFFIKSPIAKLL